MNTQVKKLVESTLHLDPMEIFDVLVDSNKPRSNETMMEQIRRLNKEEAVKHELRRQEALNKIKQLREKQRNEEQRRNVIPQ